MSDSRKVVFNAVDDAMLEAASYGMTGLETTENIVRRLESDGLLATPSPSPVGVDAMREALDKAQAALIKYEGEVDGDTPSHHILLMDEIEAALASSPQSVPGDLTDDQLMAVLLELKLSPDTYKALTITRWKDGIDLDFPSWDFKCLARRLATRSPAGTFADGIEAAAKVAEQHGEPYSLNTATSAMMFRAVTEKIASAIRSLKPHPTPAGRDEETIFDQYESALRADNDWLFEQDTDTSAARQLNNTKITASIELRGYFRRALKSTPSLQGGPELEVVGDFESAGIRRSLARNDSQSSPATSHPRKEGGLGL